MNSGVQGRTVSRAARRMDSARTGWCSDVIRDSQIVCGRASRWGSARGQLGRWRLPVELPGDARVVDGPGVFSLLFGQPVSMLHRLGQRSDLSFPIAQGPPVKGTQGPVSRGEAGVERDRLLEQGNRLDVVIRRLPRAVLRCTSGAPPTSWWSPASSGGSLRTERSDSPMLSRSRPESRSIAAMTWVESGAVSR